MGPVEDFIPYLLLVLVLNFVVLDFLLCEQEQLKQILWLYSCIMLLRLASLRDTWLVLDMRGLLNKFCSFAISFGTKTLWYS